MNSEFQPVAARDAKAWSEIFWNLWAMLAAFSTYFSMYAFRKPYTAATYEGEVLGSVDDKTTLIIAQVLGYTLSKFIGIRVVSEVSRRHRAMAILWLVLVAEGALIMFGFAPGPWKIACLFLNGLPLGMVFGMVLGLLEGRRMTEALTAGLCASFILADGATKSVGAWLLSVEVSESWMPAAAGGLFLLPLAASVAMLSRIPAPSNADVEARTERTPMNRAARKAFVHRYFWGITAIVVIYLAMTILRSLRADFAPEIWKGLGVTAQPTTFTRSEIWVALGVLFVNGLTVTLRDNRVAFFSSLGTCATGVVLLIAAMTLRTLDAIDPFGFMVLLGLGMYLPYVAIHTTVFERWLAMTRERGTSSFLMYVVDSIGYLGYVAVMLGKPLLARTLEPLGLLTGALWVSIVVSMVCLVGCWWYFRNLAATELDPVGSPKLDKVGA